MGRVSTAFRAFFGALFYAEIAARVAQALETDNVTTEVTPGLTDPQQATPVEVKPKQSEALSLLATLQREARLIDFFKEDIGPYTDDQVGAAVREIHRESQGVLERFFAIRSIREDEEGASVQIPTGYDAGRFRLTGKLTGSGPFTGILRHHGWEATRCELPEFTGNESAARTIAPAEVEIV